MSHARAERHALADLLDRVGPAAPTLCAGWATADLAAHLVLRERRPDAAGGILVPALSSRTDRIQRRIRDGRPWPELVETVRSGPPLPLRPLDEAVNVVEYFVHHEDVRRAVDGWEPRTLPPGLDEALWRRLRAMAPLLFRRAGMPVELRAPGHGTSRPRLPTAGLLHRHGRSPAGADVDHSPVGAGVGPVGITGPPGELLLAGFGRLAHARVDLDGPPGSLTRLRSARLGL